MKTQKIVLLSATFFALAVQAGVEKFDSAGFNSIIEESSRAQDDLQKDLQKTAGIQPDKEFRKTEALQETPSSYLVETNDFPKTHTAKSGALSKKEMHRVAQEFKALE